jgi:hypothetical protein
MSRPTSGKPWKRAVQGSCALLALLVFTGCETAQAKRVRELARQDPVPYVARVLFEQENAPALTEGAAGASELFALARDTIMTTLKECNAFSVVLAGAEEEASPQHDIVVRAKVSQVSDLACEGTSTEGALLEVLAWSTVGPVSLWVPDAEYNVHLKIAYSVEDLNKRRLLPEEFAKESPSVRLAMTDRLDPLEDPLQYAGALVIPPFLFASEDRDQVKSELARDFLSEKTCEFVELLKKNLQPDITRDVERITVALTRCDRDGDEATAFIGVRLPRGECFTKFIVSANGNDALVCRKNRDALAGFSADCWDGREVPVRVNGLTKGRSLIRVEARGYDEEDVSFTFVVEGGSPDAEAVASDTAFQAGSTPHERAMHAGEGFVARRPAAAQGTAFGGR